MFNGAPLSEILERDGIALLSLCFALFSHHLSDSGIIGLRNRSALNKQKCMIFACCRIVRE